MADDPALRVPEEVKAAQPPGYFEALRAEHRRRAAEHVRTLQQEES